MECVGFNGSGQLVDLGPVASPGTSCAYFLLLTPAELPAPSILQPLAISEAEQIASAAILLFALVFIFRAIARVISTSQKEES